MEPIAHRALHESLGARFGEVNGIGIVRDYGDPSTEYKALCNAAAVVDLSHRGRVCLTGSDRIRFLNGQVTNNVKALHPGQGCYAALVTAKGKMESDLHIHCLNDELLIDFEPGLTAKVVARLEKYLVADDVEVVDLQPHYDHISIQGPNAAEVLQRIHLPVSIPAADYESVTVNTEAWGELVIAKVPHLANAGIDVFTPTASTEKMMKQLLAAADTLGGQVVGWTAMDWLRIEGGIPRFNQDLDETNIPLEAGIEERAVKYNKGCYVGQEVINRIHSVGQVSKSLRGLVLPSETDHLPNRGDELAVNGKPVGYVTSAVRSPRFQRTIAMGYLRREVNQPETKVIVKSAAGEQIAKVVNLPFAESQF